MSRVKSDASRVRVARRIESCSAGCQLQCDARWALSGVPLLRCRRRRVGRVVVGRRVGELNGAIAACALPQQLRELRRVLEAEVSPLRDDS